MLQRLRAQHMAIPTSCCLNIPPPTSASTLSSSNTKTTTTKVSWFKDEKWRNQCILGVATMIIGVEMDIMVNEGSHFAMAVENSTISGVESKMIPRTSRWSDRRACPPWRLNSLETIVPENLPRPSARRRSEAIDYSKNAPAPAVKDPVKSIMIINNCFTM